MNKVKEIRRFFINIPPLENTKYPAPLRYIDLFCGIGGFRYAAQDAFEVLGIEGKCVFSSDIDKYAQDSYEANFGKRPSGDITKIAASDIPDFDVLFGGFPCQAFSICGLMKGFEDSTRGTLFFDIARILKEKQPQAFVLENVKNLANHDNGNTLRTILGVLRDELGYNVEYRVLNALDFGLPQKRERILILGSKKSFKMNWEFNITQKKTLTDILEENVDSKHFASAKIVAKRKSMHTPKVTPSIWHENKSGNISSYPYSCALRAGASYNYLLVNGERRLTPREMLRLQGFPDDFKIVVSDCQTRKQAGNAIPIDMVEKVIERFLPMAF
jgi:DNA (cytosine-5)-methyltransferase 1